MGPILLRGGKKTRRGGGKDGRARERP